MRNWFRLVPVFLLLICSGLGAQAGIELSVRSQISKSITLTGPSTAVSMVAPADRVEDILSSLRIPKSDLEVALEGIIELEEDDESEKKSAQKMQQAADSFDSQFWMELSLPISVQVPQSSLLPTKVLFLLNRNFRL